MNVHVKCATKALSALAMTSALVSCSPANDSVRVGRKAIDPNGKPTPTSVEPLAPLSRTEQIELGLVELTRLAALLRDAAPLASSTTPTSGSCIKKRIVNNPRSQLRLSWIYENCNLTYELEDEKVPLKVTTKGGFDFKNKGSGVTTVLGLVTRLGERLAGEKKQIAFTSRWKRELQSSPLGSLYFYEVESLLDQEDVEATRVGNSERWSVLVRGNWDLSNRKAFKLGAESSVTITYWPPHSDSKKKRESVQWLLTNEAPIELASGCERPTGRFVLWMNGERVGTVDASTTGWQEQTAGTVTWPTSCYGEQ